MLLAHTLNNSTLDFLTLTSPLLTCNCVSFRKTKVSWNLLSSWTLYVHFCLRALPTSWHWSCPSVTPCSEETIDSSMAILNVESGCSCKSLHQSGINRSHYNEKKLVVSPCSNKFAKMIILNFTRD